MFITLSFRNSEILFVNQYIIVPSEFETVLRSQINHLLSRQMVQILNGGFFKQLYNL